MPDFVTLLMQMPTFAFDEVVREDPRSHLAMMKASGKMLDISTERTSEEDANA